MDTAESGAVRALDGVVDFVGIGAPKSGTTWVWEQLRRHPDLYLPDEKEIYYFNAESYEDPTIRNPNFGKPTSRTAPERMAALNPGVRLFAILRDPVERTFSDYLFRTQRGTIPPMPFERAVEEDPVIVDRSFYGGQLAHYLDHFPPEQVRVLLYDRLRDQPEELIADLYGFLGVPAVGVAVTEEAVNQSGVAAHPRLNRMIMRSRTALKRYRLEWLVDAARKVGVDRVSNRIRNDVTPYSAEDRPTIDPATERSLRERFDPDLARLEALAGIDVSAWRAAG
jgi:hypothetical protein